MKKVISFIAILSILILSISTTVFAATGTTKLELVEDNVCNINMEDIAKFEKKLTDFNANDKKAQLTLTVTNTKEASYHMEPAEIFLVVDSSRSMRENNVSTGVTRKEAVISSANLLIDKLFEANSDIKIGVVKFSSLDSSDGVTQEGTIDDAELINGLTSSKSEVKSALDKIASEEGGVRTNLEAGITIASQNFSSNTDVNKYLIVLSDGVPNNDIHGNFAEYSDAVTSATKAKLEDIKNSGVNVIAVLTGVDPTYVDGLSSKTYGQVVNEVFGVSPNLSVNKFFNIQDNEIEDTIVKEVFDELVVYDNNSITNLVIKDYFPKEIIDNFDFKYTSSPNIGSISTSIDSSTNCITWTIPELKQGETATVTYTLTLKDSYNKNIENKILPTNEKVDIDYTFNSETKTVSSTDSPKVRVTSENIADKPIPQAGETSTIIAIISISIITVFAITRIAYIKRNNI